MYDHSLRHKIATGSLTLPVTALTAAGLRLTAGESPSGTWPTLALIAATAYLLMELNNRFTLLRIRSRMMASSFLVLVAALPSLGADARDALPATALIAAYFPLFSAYQSPRDSGHVFYAFTLIAAAALLFPPLLLLALPLLFSMGTQLRCLSGKTFTAALLGMATPAWLMLAAKSWYGETETFLADFADAFRFAAPDYDALSENDTSAAALLAVLTLPALIHLLRYAYNDKIRTRMFFYLIILIEAMLWAAWAAQPQASDILLPLLTANSAPLIGHYFAQTSGRTANVWFVAALLMILSLTLFHYIPIWTH